MQRRTAYLLRIGGLVAPVLWVAAFLYSGALLPGYSQYRQYVSELAARGTPTQHFMQVTGFVIPGLLIAGFGCFLGLTGRTRVVAIAASFVIVSGIAKIVAGIFPQDPCCGVSPPSVDQQIHTAAGATFYFTLSMAALMWFFAAPRAFGQRFAWFRWYSLASVVLAIVSPLLLIWAGAASSGDVGLFQRVSFGVLNLWIFVFAASTWSHQAANTVERSPTAVTDCDVRSVRL